MSWTKEQQAAFDEAVANPGKAFSVDHGATTEEGKRMERTFGKTLETFHFDEVGAQVVRWYMSASAERGERTAYHADGRFKAHL